MTEQEINRAIQYVTAATSYGRDTVAEVLRTGLSELAQLSTQSTCRFEREDLMGYLCLWTMKRTGHPEPLVREVLDGAGRMEWPRRWPSGARRRRMAGMTMSQAQQRRKWRVDDACRS